MGPLSGRGRRGYVLVVVLLLSVALTALAHAALVTARTHRRAGGWVGQARARHLAAVSLAAGAARALDSLDTPPATLELPGARGHTDVVPLSREVGLLRARVDSAGSEAAAAALVWALDPGTRVAGLPRAVEVGTWPDAATLAAIATGESLVCPPDELPDPIRPLVRTPEAGVPEAADPLSLGRLDGAEVLRSLGPLGAPAGTPEPAVLGGACEEGAWVWGAWAPPDHPCRDTWIALARSGDLLLQGGEGQGLLVIDGSLAIDGTRFRGLLLVRGDLAVTGGAFVEGVARVGGTLTIAGGSWRAGPCAAWHALAAATALRAPRTLFRPGWVLH